MLQLSRTPKNDLELVYVQFGSKCESAIFGFERHDFASASCRTKASAGHSSNTFFQGRNQHVVLREKVQREAEGLTRNNHPIIQVASSQDKGPRGCLPAAWTSSTRVIKQLVAGRAYNSQRKSKGTADRVGSRIGKRKRRFPNTEINPQYLNAECCGRQTGKVRPYSLASAPAGAGLFCGGGAPPSGSFTSI